MPRNLRDDYRMYYQGTWILREVDGHQEVMSVEDCGYRDHGFYPRNIYFTGSIYKLDEAGRAVASDSGTFTADQIIPFTPESGYYIVGTTPIYLEFQVANRRNRKGFESKGVVTVGGQSVRLSTSDVIYMFLKPDFKGKIFSDIALIKSRVHWRGNDVGQFHDGVLQLDEQYNYLTDYLGKQIEMFKGRNGGL